jgi:O-antigen/teichoic acid export membrane protein
MSSDELAGLAQKAARGGLFLFIGNACSTVILAVGTIIVGRLLGPSVFGLYTLTPVIPILAVSLSDAGMSFALVRLPARFRSEGDYARANRLVRLGFLLKLTISTVAFFICYFGSATIAITILNRPELVPFLRLASLIIVFQAVLDATTNSFIGQDLMQYSASIQVMQATLKGTLAPALVLVGLGITGALSGYVLSLAGAGLTGATILLVRHVHSSEKIDSSVLGDLGLLLGYGLPLYLATALSVFQSQYQSILLARFAGNLEIGNFNASWNFNTFLAVFTYPITTAIFPMFSKMHPTDQVVGLARAFQLAVKYSSLVMFPVSVGVMVFSRNLIYLTYGSRYGLAPDYLLLLSASYLLGTIGSLVLGSFFNGVADTRTVVKISVLTLGVYLPLGPILAWLWGPYGILVVNILSAVASTLYGLRQASVRFNARPDLNGAVGIALAGLGAAIPTVALVQLDGAGPGALNLVLGGLLYLVVYLTLAPITKAVVEQDVLNLRIILGSTRAIAVLVNPILDYESCVLRLLRK